MAATKAPHRIFGAFGVVQTFSAICAFTLLSWFLHRYGWQSAFVFLAIPGALCFAAVPKRFAAVQLRESSGTIRPKDALGLLSILVFFTAEATIWPFLQRIGASRGVGDFAIAGALSFGALCGLLGSAAIMALPARTVRLRTVAFTAALNVCAIAVLAVARPAYAFVAALGLFNFAWAAFAPLQLSLLRKLGATARTFTLASTATTIGFALGPALGGMLAHTRGYGPAFGVGMLGTLIAVALLATPLRYTKAILRIDSVESTLPS
jgi:predicted MFS family arabinose efflux permease